VDILRLVDTQNEVIDREERKFASSLHTRFNQKLEMCAKKGLPLYVTVRHKTYYNCVNRPEHNIYYGPRISTICRFKVVAELLRKMYKFHPRIKIEATYDEITIRLIAERNNNNEA